MNYSEEYLKATEKYLSGCFTEELPQKKLFEAMRYSLLAGGKRIRPTLVLEFCRICGGTWEKAVPVAAALEMIHTYSLIHDDLPCMDNDDYRRGKLTNHKVFGEAGAVLAGDGLLTAAFDHAAQAGFKRTPEIISCLSQMAGPYGMVGGQQLDLDFENKDCTEAQLQNIHNLKTACLIRAACRLGVLTADGTEEQMAAAEKYAVSVGLAFQMKDDILDVIGDAKKMGKQTGKDTNKNTFVKIYGVEKCETIIRQETENAIAAISVLPDSEFLSGFAMKLAKRDY